MFLLSFDNGSRTKSIFQLNLIFVSIMFDIKCENFDFPPLVYERLLPISVDFTLLTTVKLSQFLRLPSNKFVHNLFNRQMIISFTIFLFETWRRHPILSMDTLRFLDTLTVRYLSQSALSLLWARPCPEILL